VKQRTKLFQFKHARNMFLLFYQDGINSHLEYTKIDVPPRSVFFFFFFKCSVYGN